MPCDTCAPRLGVVPRYMYSPQRQSIGAWRNVRPDRRETIVSQQAIDPATILRLRDGDPRRVAEDVRAGITRTVARPTNLGAISPAWLGGVTPVPGGEVPLPAQSEGSKTNWGLVVFAVLAVLALTAGAAGKMEA